MAFSEAVQSYEEGKGSFRGLAAMVIRRRVVDYLRTEGRHADELSVTPAAFEDGLEEEEAGGVNLQVQQRMAEEADDAPGEDTASLAREEIAEMQGILQLYGFSFFDLADASPKTEKTKKSCAQAVRTLIATAILMAQMRLKRLLPIVRNVKSRKPRKNARSQDRNCPHRESVRRGSARIVPLTNTRSTLAICRLCSLKVKRRATRIPRRSKKNRNPRSSLGRSRLRRNWGTASGPISRKLSRRNRNSVTGRSSDRRNPGNGRIIHLPAKVPRRIPCRPGKAAGLREPKVREALKLPVMVTRESTAVPTIPADMDRCDE